MHTEPKDKEEEEETMHVFGNLSVPSSTWKKGNIHGIFDDFSLCNFVLYVCTCVCLFSFLRSFVCVGK